jgi:uncharacterized membrane protein
MSLLKKAPGHVPGRDDAGELPRIFMSLNRLETLGDAIFAFSLTLLAFDLNLPEIAGGDLKQRLIALLPKLVIFIFTFLVVAQQWDVHQRTLRYIVRADGTFIWLNLLSFMFIVLLPMSADVLGNYPLEPLALLFFGIILAMFSLISWFIWRYASGKGKLLQDGMDSHIVNMIGNLWLSTPVIIAACIPLSYLSVYPVYAIWFLMPIFSYFISIRTVQKIRDKSEKKV